MLRNIENKRDNNLGYLHKFNKTKSDFDFKPKNVNLESQDGDVNDVNETNMSIGSRTPKKKWKSMVIKTSEDTIDVFGNGHKDDTYIFRSQSRNTRDKMLTPKKDYMANIDYTPKFAGVQPRTTVGLAFGQAICRDKSKKHYTTQENFYRKNKVLSPYL